MWPRHSTCAAVPRATLLSPLPRNMLERRAVPRQSHLASDHWRHQMILWQRTFSALFGTLLAGMLLSAPAQAQNYPNRAITFVVPFAPGGLTDIPARVLAAVMQERIGASIVVENKTGGSGVIGASHVWRSDPDGYTLLVNALADVQNLHYIPVPYNAVTDFAMIGKIADG